MKEKKRKIGQLILIGKNGVGKKEIKKEIEQLMLKDDKEMVSIDMQELMEKN